VGVSCVCDSRDPANLCDGTMVLGSSTRCVERGRVTPSGVTDDVVRYISHYLDSGGVIDCDRGVFVPGIAGLLPSTSRSYPGVLQITHSTEVSSGTSVQGRRPCN
jgi:hypothetical protein